MQNGTSSKFIKKMVASLTVGTTAILVLVPAITQANPGSSAKPSAQASPAAPANVPPAPMQSPSPGGSMTSPEVQVPASPAAPATSAPAASPTAATNTVVDVATSAGSFTTLTRAIEAAGLTETLKGAGPFTVFAPTDEAFAALPAGTLESLLKPENREKLVKILTYHVVSGRVTSGDLKAGAVTTLEGSPATVRIDRNKVQVNNASVTRADVLASNGVIHVIDRVLLPPDL